jgi:hypothetical protein
MTKVWLWLSIIFFSCSSMLGSAWLGLIGGLSGLFSGMILSFVALSAIFRGVNSRRPKGETSGKPEIQNATRFPLYNCIWGPLSLLFGAVIYQVISSIASNTLLVPPLQVDFSLLPEMLKTVDEVLSASQIGVMIAATMAFLTALIRNPREGLHVSGIAWIPVLIATVPCFVVTFGLGRLTDVSFAATAVILAGLPRFIRSNAELASSPVATGRIMFFVLEAVYTSLISGLTAVIVIEFFSGRSGVGYSIMLSTQLFEIARLVAAIALVWLAVALLSFVVRCAQSIVVRS